MLNPKKERTMRATINKPVIAAITVNLMRCAAMSAARFNALRSLCLPRWHTLLFYRKFFCKNNLPQKATSSWFSKPKRVCHFNPQATVTRLFNEELWGWSLHFDYQNTMARVPSKPLVNPSEKKLLASNWAPRLHVKVHWPPRLHVKVHRPPAEWRSLIVIDQEPLLFVKSVTNKKHWAFDPQVVTSAKCP